MSENEMTPEMKDIMDRRVKAEVAK